jgi:hypothetical protein
LREALARSSHDFVVSEPARARKPRPRRGLFATLGAILRFAHRIAAYPNRIAGALLFALALAITVNALMLQHSRHPAPLFREHIILPAHRPLVHALPERAAHVSAPVEQPQAPIVTDEPTPPVRDPIKQLLTSEPIASHPARAEPHRHLHRTEHAVPTPIRAPSHDSISQFLKSHPPQTAQVEDNPKLVLAAQRALLKLGFVLKTDGQMGGVTRRAIKQYEHDRNLPIHGELTPALLHRLSTESGIRIR